RAARSQTRARRRRVHDPNAAQARARREAEDRRYAGPAAKRTPGAGAADCHGMTRESDVALLIERLLETGQRLEELTGGEVDSVVDRDGRTFLLGRAQQQLREIQSAKQSAILNALPAHI